MRLPLRLLSAAIPALLAFSCSSASDFYREVSRDPEARELHDVIENETDPDIRAVAMERLAGHLLHHGGPDVLVAYLTTFTEKHPNDPFGGLYLYLVAQTYLEQGAGALALQYFQRVIHGYPEVITGDVSTRKASLDQLVRLSPDPERRARYYEIILEEYGSQADEGVVYYRLGKTYEELGEWELAFDAYRQFIRYPESQIPGEPNAHRIITDRVAFYDSPKNWTLPSLEDLRRTVTWAIVNKDTRTLLRYRSGVSFFTRSWEQDFEDPNATPLWDLGEILRLSRRVSVDPEVDVDAEGDEAYLWTYGWGGLRIRTWYLYFRKVYFPPDPEIHGTWEWAGIYLGERL